MALDRRFQTAVRLQNETAEWLVASREWIGGLVLRLKCGRRFEPRPLGEFYGFVLRSGRRIEPQIASFLGE